MLIIFVSVIGLCLWDNVHTSRIFEHMESESLSIYSQLEDTNQTTNLLIRAENLNNYWTKEMDILCISISRKDLQPVSDYLQYLCTSLKLNDFDNALIYSRLLHYNIEGLMQANGIEMLNLL